MCVHLNSIMICGNIIKYLTILSILQGLNAAKSARYSLTWKVFNCTFHKEYLSQCSCSILGTDKNQLSGDFYYIKEIYNPNAAAILTISRPPRNKQVTLFDSTIDVCKLLAESAVNKFVLNIYKSVILNTNQPKKCPLKKGLLFYHNISVLDGLPAFLPEAKFLLKLNFFVPENIYFLNLTLIGQLAEKIKGHRTL